ncbi:hypothetical protein niasHS_011526 [Heterodera schachtii]|uniref:Uncharacterized protein n=2 Tax=Heterodera TaxID=34509 RepID=A0ABD2I8Q7_HETSC
MKSDRIRSATDCFCRKREREHREKQALIAKDEKHTKNNEKSSTSTPAAVVHENNECIEIVEQQLPEERQNLLPANSATVGIGLDSVCLAYELPEALPSQSAGESDGERTNGLKGPPNCNAKTTEEQLQQSANENSNGSSSSTGGIFQCTTGEHHAKAEQKQQQTTVV